MKMTVWLPLFLLPFLIACAPTRVVTKPEVVTVTKTEWRPVPADLVTPENPSAIPNGVTYGDALALWAEDRKSLAIVNGRLAAIKSLGD